MLGVTPKCRYVPRMGESAGLPPKKDVMTALLESSSVYLHLDPRREGVVVPKWLMSQPQLVLQVGLNMAVRIPDLDVGDDGVSCTLSFNRSPFWCFMPWSAIYGLVGDDGRGMIWPEDVPVELSQPQTQPTRSRPRLEAVPPPEPATAPAIAAPARATKASADESRAPAAKATSKKPRAATKVKSPKVSDAVVPAALPPEAPASPPLEDDSQIHEDPAPLSPPTQGGKRPLPPYLRVVK